MTLNGLLQKSPASLPILQATFGLERESLRISKINHRVAQKLPKLSTLKFWGVAHFTLTFRRITASHR